MLGCLGSVVNFRMNSSALRCALRGSLAKAGGPEHPYPGWLLWISALFLLAGLGCLILRTWQRNGRRSQGRWEGSCVPKDMVTADLWTLCPLTVLTVIHGLALWVGSTGLPFQ